MSRSVDCPECSRKLNLPEGLLGATVRCPVCRAEFLPPPPRLGGPLMVARPEGSAPRGSIGAPGPWFAAFPEDVKPPASQEVSGPPSARVDGPDTARFGAIGVPAATTSRGPERPSLVRFPVLDPRLVAFLEDIKDHPND